MQTSDKASIPETVMARQVGEETVILNLETGTYFGLDPLGARIWELVALGRTVGEVCEAMLPDYDVTRERLERDVLALMGDLQAHGLIRVGA